MSIPVTVLIEVTVTGLLLGFTLWVLAVQPLALARGMPRPKFLGLQMRIVRVWSRTVPPLTLAGAVAALLRLGWGSGAVPALAALAAALVLAVFAIPRALKAGGLSARADEEHDLTSSGFLSEGGGASTRVWHRLVLVGVIVVLGGRIMDAHGALASLTEVAKGHDAGR